jgi:ketosteroid isomerase-like protein
MRHGIVVPTAIAIALAGGLAGPAFAQTPEDPAHAELRALRTQVLEAITSGDIERTLALVHPNVVVTWQNHEVSRGREGLRDFFQRTGRNAFRGYKVDPTPDDLTILYGGDTGVSFGGSVGEYQLLGRSLEFHNRWTATLVKEDGRWLLAAYHVSNNTLDNPLLNAAERSVVWAGALSLAAGVIAGVIIGRRRKRASA